MISLIYQFKRYRRTPIGFLYIALAFILLSGCLPNNKKKQSFQNKVIVNSAHKPLKGDVHSNVCRIFAQKPGWYQSALKSQKKWRTPIHVMMSIMKQESSFRAKARPPKRMRINASGKRVPASSAYGYAQAQNGTWRDYQKHTGKFHHRRDRFDHAIDFIGWYTAQSRNKLNLKSYDTYNLYLAYHDGMTGFLLKTYQKKPWLIKVAKKVRNNGYKYAKQLKQCVPTLKKGKKLKSVEKNNMTTKKISTPSNNQKSAQTTHKAMSKLSKKKQVNNKANKGCSKIFGVWPFCSPFQRSN